MGFSADGNEKKTKEVGKDGNESDPEPYVPSEGSASDTDVDLLEQVRVKIDPVHKQVNDFLRNVNIYEEQNLDVERPFYMRAKRLQGYATHEGTSKFFNRAIGLGDADDLDVHPTNFRTPFQSDLKISSLGIGTYMGDPDDITDFLMYDAIKQSVLSGGINHIDTAPNYRYMKSEKTVGKILTTLENKYDIDRSQLFVTSKAGYVPEDAENQISLRLMLESLIVEHGVPEDSIVSESAHCMHPTFLEWSLADSLRRLNLETLDCLYLHNAYESQGPFNTDNVFFDRLAEAFEFMEKMVEAGKIRSYGMATYSCFRVKPTEAKMHLNLQKVERIAQKVVGEDKKHNFKYIQVPANVLMPESFVELWQAFEDD